MPRLVNYSRSVMAALALILVSASAPARVAIASQPAGPVPCEIRATPEGGLVSLKALAQADRKVSGTYSFRVESAGRTGGTDIQQGGAFSTAPGHPATLAFVTLDAQGSVYDAKLELTVGGKSIGCAERVGGAT